MILFDFLRSGCGGGGFGGKIIRGIRDGLCVGWEERDEVKGGE